MAMKPLKSIKWPDLPDTYWVVQADGSYQQMTVGNAEQLVGTVGIQDKVPYNFRTSGGAADIGDREIDKIIGGTVAWNQLMENGDFQSKSGWYPTDGTVSNGVFSYTTASDGAYNCTFSRNVAFVENHKFLISCKAKCTAGNVIRTRYPFISDSMTLTANTWSEFAAIGIGTSTEKSIGVQFNSVAGQTNSIKEIVAFDLTQMFGSTIADYIYALETATPGAGVAWFRKLFPKPYYSYNAGQLMSVKTNAHKMTGFNQWDEEWEVGGISSTDGANISQLSTIRSKNYIRVIPGATYYNYCATTGVGSWDYLFYYDASKNYIGNSGGYKANTTVTMPVGAHYMRFQCNAEYGTTYNHDICINLHWDGERDGEYEPYEEHSYLLDDVELRGIPKLDSDNNLYYDGDEYESDGTVTRKSATITLSENQVLGSGNCIRNSNGLWCCAFGNLDATASQKIGGSILCDKIATTSLTYSMASIDGLARVSSSNSIGLICLTDATSGLSASSTSAEAAAALSAYINARLPLTFTYELATPTTESADPYQNPQVVNDWGTEEYVDAAASAETPTRDVAIPVGHDTFYQPNLRAKLEMAPDSPADGDGDYIVRQTNGVNAYVKLIKELPTAPTTDGSYHLKCTVASGTPTLTWEADT